MSTRIEAMALRVWNGLTWRLALMLVVGMTATAGASVPDTNCPGDVPGVRTWVSATVVSIDTQWRRCTIFAPTGTTPAGTGTCLEIVGPVCYAPNKTVVDGIARSVRDPYCGLAAGRHSLDVCGFACGDVDLPVDAIVPVNIRETVPRLTVRIDRVLSGARSLEHTLLAGELREWSMDHPDDPRAQLIGLTPGQSMELNWPPGDVPQFAWRRGRCSYSALHPAPPPGCTRCDGAGSGSAVLAAFALIAIVRRRGVRGVH